jgi:hypothetical protein
MTHMLHRHGSVESLKGDFPVLTMVARQYDLKDDETKARGVAKLRQVADLFESHGPVVIGSPYVPGTSYHGYSHQEIRERLKPNGVIIATFGSREKLKETLAELKARDIGLSTTVSGLIDDVFEVCEEVGLKPHTISYSLGIWGKKYLLPRAELLEITTMCGHALTSANLVNKAIEDVRSGAKTPEEAAQTLAEPCVCGCFNIARAARLVTAAAAR